MIKHISDIYKIKPVTTIEDIYVFQDIFKRFTGMNTYFIDLNSKLFKKDIAGTSDYCIAIGEQVEKGLKEKCLQSDYIVCKKIKEIKKPYIYKCYAGLTEIIVPIIINQEAAGVVITEQFRAEEDEFPVNNFNNIEKTIQDKLKDLYLKMPVFSQKNIKACTDLLSLIINHMFKNESKLVEFNGSSEQISYVKEIVSNAIEYIKEHYNNPDISLIKVAKELHLSPFYLSHIFNKELKITFVDYVTKIRLEESIRIMKNDINKSIKQIAFQVGYEDQYYFSKVFRKNYNVSPAQYRSKFLNK